MARVFLGQIADFPCVIDECYVVYSLRNSTVVISCGLNELSFADIRILVIQIVRSALGHDHAESDERGHLLGACLTRRRVK